MKETKLRVLAFHGYRQNPEVFKKSMNLLEKELSMWVDFKYAHAPYEVLLVENPDDLDLGEKLSKKQYGWFFNRENLTNRGIRKGGPAIGYEKTIELVESIFDKYGPFDGILGFSQGACLAGLLCDLQHRHLIKAKFEFAIFIGGFKSKCLPHLKYFDSTIHLPSLHVIGDCDEIIPRTMSNELAESFEHPVFLRHEGGHCVPTSPQDIQKYKEFFGDLHELLT